MQDWSKIRDAYGTAEKIPDLIRALPDNDAWDAVWSRLCHQGTVYEASYEALPLLTSAMRGFTGMDRLTAIVLIGSIIASDIVEGASLRPMHIIAPLLDEWRAVANQALYRERSDNSNFLHALSAACAFEGHYAWARSIEILPNEPTALQCPECDHELGILENADGTGFLAIDSWSDADESEKPPISVADDQIDAGARWLIDTLRTHQRDELANLVRLTQGTSHCPYCAYPIDIRSAIAR